MHANNKKAVAMPSSEMLVLVMVIEPQASTLNSRGKAAPVSPEAELMQWEQ